MLQVFIYIHVLKNETIYKKAKLFYIFLLYNRKTKFFCYNETCSNNMFHNKTSGFIKFANRFLDMDIKPFFKSNELFISNKSVDFHRINLKILKKNLFHLKK